MSDTKPVDNGTSDLIFWLRRLAQLLEEDRVQMAAVDGKPLSDLVEVAKGNWNRAQEEVDKLKHP